MTIKKYTGWDGNALRKLAGTERIKDWIVFLYGNKRVRNLGTWSVRLMKNKNQTKPLPSVHGTGRAWDCGYTVRADGLKLCDFFVANAEALGVEAVHDYMFGKYGRGWRCNRDKWLVYDKPTLGGRGNWLHIEFNPEVANDPKYVDCVFKNLFEGK